MLFIYQSVHFTKLSCIGLRLQALLHFQKVIKSDGSSLPKRTAAYDFCWRPSFLTNPLILSKLPLICDVILCARRMNEHRRKVHWEEFIISRISWVLLLMLLIFPLSLQMAPLDGPDLFRWSRWIMAYERLSPPLRGLLPHQHTRTLLR